MQKSFFCGLMFSVITLCACQRSDLVAPTRAIASTGPSYMTEAGEECPTNWIYSATIPGNVYPYHQVTVGQAGLYTMPFDRLMDISATGLEKGRYILGGGGPWVSQDNKIAVVSGKVTGWCHYTRITGFPNNYTGSLQVTDFDGEIVNIPPPKPKESECDDPLTDIVEECDPNNPPPGGPYVGEGGTTEQPGFTSGGASGSTWVCYVTDWYESYDGGSTWYYTDTTVDYCTLE